MWSMARRFILGSVSLELTQRLFARKVKCERPKEPAHSPVNWRTTEIQQQVEKPAFPRTLEVVSASKLRQEGKIERGSDQSC